MISQMATTTHLGLVTSRHSELQGLPADERQLIESCLNDDSDAQQELYERYSVKVYRRMYRMVGPRDVDDLTQQVFLCVFRKLDKFHWRSSFSTWLYRVASNDALQFLRRGHRTSDQQIDFELADERSNTIDQIDLQETLDYLLNRLDPALRAIFLLRESGLSYYDIAIPDRNAGSYP